MYDRFKEKQETGSSSPLIHGIVWDRDYITCIDTGSFDPDGCITVMDMESSDF